MFFKRIDGKCLLTDDEAKEVVDDNMGNIFLGEVLKNRHEDHSHGCF